MTGSIQEVSKVEKSGNANVVAQDLMSTTFLAQIMGNMLQAPSYWSRTRDNWMVDFVKLLGNDLLAGAMATLVAKVVATSWYIEGPLSLAIFTMRMLRDQMDFGDGWEPGLERWVQGYLGRDAGGYLEHLRTSVSDTEGPALGFAHLDESLCLPTKDPEYPVIYYHPKKGPIKLHRSRVSRLVDMDEGRDRYRGVGFCSVSRALSTAMILMDIVRYKRERLSDLPPAAILMLNNMTESQWKDILTRYDTRMGNDGNTTWRNILVACGYDPAFPVGAELFELSSLPEHYDEETATSIAIYSFALAFRVDPREYWPVSAGPLGTAHEATLQHIKAKAKGEGIIFSQIERLFAGPYALSPLVKFKFDYREDDDDRAQAEIVGLRISNVRKMWESSPNQSQLGDYMGEGASMAQEFPGIISTEEARALLVRWGCVPPDVLGVSVDVDRVYDTRALEQLGPMARVYNDGKAVLW
jgi:hypothetical protein